MLRGSRRFGSPRFSPRRRFADETGISALDRSADLAQSKYGWREVWGGADAARDQWLATPTIATSLMTLLRHATDGRVLLQFEAFRSRAFVCGGTDRLSFAPRRVDSEGIRRRLDVFGAAPEPGPERQQRRHRIRREGRSRALVEYRRSGMDVARRKLCDDAQRIVRSLARRLARRASAVGRPRASLRQEYRVQARANGTAAPVFSLATSGPAEKCRLQAAA